MARRKKGADEDPARAAFASARARVAEHPLFGEMIGRTWIREGRLEGGGYALVDGAGHITVDLSRGAGPATWTWVLAHCLTHLAFGHAGYRRDRDWDVAADAVAAGFLADVKVGSPLPGFQPGFPERDVEKLYQRFLTEGVPPSFRGWGTGPQGETGLREGQSDHGGYFAQLFAEGLARSVREAVRQAAGAPPLREASTMAQAREWFLSSYPLLGGLAAGFEILEDIDLCHRMQIQVAAVDVELREIYVNPLAQLDEDQARFVLAHELLHAGLRHPARRRGRDPYFWNVACDFVINAWLVEMRLGEPPDQGFLHDPDLAGESAESVYDTIVRARRKYRKLATLRGLELGDMVGASSDEFWDTGRGLDLDTFCRQALSQGLLAHQDQQRGLLPAGLVEEIKALQQPVIPWDVELARWFDRHFSPLEKRRTFARPSRRQASTPDIPRARWVVPPEQLAGRTFGVVLDTSGSMSRRLLGMALGAIASYAMSRDVPAVRVVFCDAAAYDEGYMRPEEIAERVRVRGRGGTVLQPGVDLLEKAGDFPSDGPILVVTDGQCDRVRVKREHAFLVPRGVTLPFRAGEVFRMG